MRTVSAGVGTAASRYFYEKAPFCVMFNIIKKAQNMPEIGIR
jgi:hypothetical protein